MNIVDWFDPFNRCHIQSFSYLERTGMWPKEFLPENIEIPSLWLISIVRKIAAAWVKAVESGDINLDSIRR